MLIEIVGTDYYDSGNPHVEVDDPGKLNGLYKIWKEVPNPGQWHYSFAEWLVTNDFARWPADHTFDTFEESYN